MNKQEFLEKLERGIADLPREDAAERRRREMEKKLESF